MSKIRLNRIKNFQLTNNEKQELKGGEWVVICTCGCCTEEGSDNVEATTVSNTNNRLKTKCAMKGATVVVVES
jgi:hypothetical protein